MIAVVGAIDEKRAAALVDKAFADLPAKGHLKPVPDAPSPAWARSTSSTSTCRNRPSASAGRR